MELIWISLPLYCLCLALASTLDVGVCNARNWNLKQRKSNNSHSPVNIWINNLRINQFLRFKLNLSYLEWWRAVWFASTDLYFAKMSKPNELGQCVLFSFVFSFTFQFSLRELFYLELIIKMIQKLATHSQHQILDAILIKYLELFLFLFREKSKKKLQKCRLLQYLVCWNENGSNMKIIQLCVALVVCHDRFYLFHFAFITKSQVLGRH